MGKPDLKDPAQLAAYRQELRGIARPLRYAGIMFALLGVALALVHRVWYPALPVIIPIAALALGALNIVAGVAARARYHRARMESD